jgi:hypothetical protein
MPTFRGLLLGAAAATVFLTTTYAQINDSIRGPASERNHFIETPKGWVHPKTPWGEPDITATLNMMQAANIPLERCANALGRGGCDMSKAWWTEEEHKGRLTAAAGRGDLGRQLIEKGEFGRALLSGVTDPSTPQRQTTLIVDPPSGLLPPLTPEGKKRALEMRSGWSLPGESPAYDWVTDFDSWDRCTTRGMPSSMMPYRYNGGFRIWQAPGVVVFELEMIHDSRVIFTDGRPPLKSGSHKQLMGESRGRWEGNTLVVDTTNYRGGHAPLINLAVVGSPAGNRFPQSDQMKTTERITRLNDEMWLYEIKTEDPVILTAPFTVRYPMRHDPNYEWWEYACHEGNTIVPNYTNTSRHERANPEPAPDLPAVMVDAKNQPAGPVPAEIAKTLVGRWVGRPELKTMDYDIIIEFAARPDGSVVGKLVETTLPDPREVPINKSLYTAGSDGQQRGFTISGRRLTFTFPNTQTWGFNGELSADGRAIEGVTNSAQGGIRLVFRKQ